MMRKDRSWKNLAKTKLEVFKKEGINNFKQESVNEFYRCSYPGIRSPFTLHLISSLPKKTLIKCLFLRKSIKNFKGSVFKKILTKFHLAMLYEYALLHDNMGILSKVEEPLIGSPTILIYQGKKVSLELLCSVLEINSLQEKTNVLKDGITILEIGAGYGRIPHVINTLYKNINYNIIDLKEILIISKSYLNKILPKADVKFIKADGNFPKKKFDLIISIANLPEMEKTDRKNYEKYVSNSCKSIFYNKQEWVRVNFAGEKTEFIDYKVNGKLISLKPDKFSPQFFEAIYKF